ncbi:Aqualysin-1 [Rhizoctonia solani]|uniref:Aqualysin-1 n=1 Tax=Rhizoctonia solani TaxID=456999 RepID=A0A0K6GJJ0_9AGAM|nr:Aqualysin-1 [Rhizoctonia solani]
MLLNSLILLFPVISLGAFAVPVGGSIPILRHAGKVKEHSYIVQLKPGASESTHFRLSTSGFNLTYTYNQVFNGYAAQLDTTTLDHIRQSPDVEAIFEDGFVEADTTSTSFSKSDNQSSLSTSISYSGEISRVDGASVDVYDIGTGIYTAHTSFGGRAHWGTTFGGYGNADGNGYDTCLAGIAVGATYGVATQANIYAVKAISDSGDGTISNIIAAINWVISAATASGRPSVVMLGTGGPANSALDAAVVSATNKGLHFIVPAPSSSSVGNTSPARVASAVTVGVTGRSYTPGVDVCSEGTAVPCPSIQGPTASTTISGAGAAMARVAGIVAAVLGAYGGTTPALMEAALKAHASTTTNGCLVINQPW